jgi:hypothetical protein
MRFTGWMMSAGLVLTAAANAQGLAPYGVAGSRYSAVSDFEGPPPYAGIPQQRGFVYMIAVIDRDGYDGRLVIDARTGRILRFMPAHRMGDNFNEDMMGPYGPTGALPPVGMVRGPPRPPGDVPHVASRTPSAVPIPRPSPPHTGDIKPLAAQPAPEPVQQSAAVQARPAAPAPVAAPVVEAKPAAPPIQPTQAMPKVQGLE